MDGREYGEALYTLAEEQGTEDSTLRELEVIRDAFLGNPDYITLLDTPALGKSEKLALLAESLASAQEYVRSLLMILCEAHGVHCYPQVLAAYQEAYDRAHNIEQIDALTATPLQEAQKEAIIRQWEARLGKKIRLRNIVDSSLLGGITLRVQGKQMDGSLRNRLEELRESLAQTVV